MKEKKDIRLHIKRQLQQLQRTQWIEKTERVHAQLFLSSIWQHATTIGITMSMPNEMNTRPIIEKGWEQGKHIAVPKVNPSSHTLHFYSLTEFAQTKVKYAGISEPDPSLTTMIPKEKFDLIIVPGIAFDKDKYRIGYGGGYYDRFLQNIGASTCALLFDFQLYERLPREKHDIPLQRLITESFIL
ncbi:5-formyltetrahydrofolate cyclo-ligase [Salibacterium salarium]|uniref:5-formyltetrahydrofolate cyclo-ligase n=1 Tax=Salibacterium salarium TaxID=284579 RepID=A0A3R9QVY3_9BACI|nr:5-formyltetrahydrofolate cyclo-ligase [Salibacterium salarium]RSL34521.1 5-formyltetrahydrofolate cyclo-ligase [Salibacterium salarium]